MPDARLETGLHRLRARELVTRPPFLTVPTDAVAAVARAMTERRIGSAVVASGRTPLGIVTDRDLRSKVVAGGYPTSGPVSGIMSAPLKTVRAEDWAFTALLEMTRSAIHHLGVTDGEGQLLGIISSNDFLALERGHPASLVKELDSATSLEGVRAAGARLPALVRGLLRAGLPAIEVTQLVAEVHDRTLQRVVQLAEEGLASDGLGRPPGPFALVVGGSEGRREQTMVTDQDNGLVHASVAEEVAGSAGDYFTRLSEGIASRLAALGVPPCPGGFMAVNPRWRLDIGRWKERFLQWMDQPEGHALVEASVFFDWRFVAGDQAAASDVWSWACTEAPRHAPFHQALAREALRRDPPLGLFGRFRVAHRGPHRGCFDVKALGLFPLVHGMRTYAVQLGLKDTGTSARIAGAVEAGALGSGEGRNLSHALETLLRTRLDAELGATMEGHPPSSQVDPSRLDAIDRAALHEAFRTIRLFQQGLADRFRTQLS
ncbi:MAG: CBS domain-containing protein [Myxococcaceae bacterium]|nr:MAG: CBS domain-containing protein [Myxococcaceae bacterium]